MRAHDRALPSFAPHDPTDAIMPWPAHVHFVLEGAAEPPYTWDQDGLVWGDAALVWDDGWRASGYTDAVCDLAGVDIAHGPPDALGLFPAGQMLATLVDPDGRYGRYNPDGTLTDFQLGRRVDVVAELDDEWWWLFAGRITLWDNNADNTVTIEAYNTPAELVPPIGAYTPGVNADKAGARMRAILTAAGRLDLASTARFDVGDVSLTAQETDRAPWEEMQVVALSDGGVLAPDADDVLVYDDRTWGAGRDDQTSIPTLSDNDCSAPVVVWNAVLSNNDDTLVGSVLLENVAGIIAERALPPDGRLPARPTLTHPEPDQWTLAEEGDVLAALMLKRRSLGQVQIGSMQLYLDAPDQDLWLLGIDMRLGDALRFWHLYRDTNGNPQRMDVGVIVQEIRHSISPHAWVVNIGTTRVVSYLDPTRFWDSGEVWDDAALVWDASAVVPV